MPELLQDLLDGSEIVLNAETEPSLLQQAEGLSSGPDGAELFILLADRKEEEAYRIALKILEVTWDPGTMAEIASAVSLSDDIVHYNRFGHAFLKRAADRQAHYGVRSNALRVATVIAQSNKPLYYRLCASLLEIDENDEGLFVRHAVRVTGALLAHGGVEELREQLTLNLKIEAARDEAAIELGCYYLNHGLKARTVHDAIHAFTTAKSFFGKAIQASESRPDAVLFLRCIDLLLLFQTDNLGKRCSDRTFHFVGEAARLTALAAELAGVTEIFGS